MKKLLLLYTFLCLSLVAKVQSIHDRIYHLIDQMTTEEKIVQLTSNTFFTTADNTRLGIPGFQMSDGPHGVRFGGASVFPVGIAQAATWDVELLERIGEAMGNEFWENGKHQQLGPCLDLCRDPRNGRSPETLGEDPFLAGEIGTALVKGIQNTPLIATAKHFNLVNKQQYRYNSNIIINDRWLIEHYGHDFRKVVQEAGVLSVMNAYNLINGIHCSRNFQLLQGILRDLWGFPFYVVSDWGAVNNTKFAIEAGTDICMGSNHYANDLPGLINSGNVSMEVLDNAVYKVLLTKLMNGMLDNYPRCTEEFINSPEHNELVLEAGRKSLVLLKNEANILPLDPSGINKIALIGPSANKAQLDGFGSSWVEPVYTVSPRQGIENIIGSSKVDYVKGCDINSNDTSGFSMARTVASDADYVIFVGGLDDTQEGEGYGDRPEYDRAGGSIDLPGKQQELINQLAGVNENVIVILKSGGICGVNNSIENIKGFIYAFYPGHEGGNAIAEAVFGLYNPGGKLPVTMPKSDTQLPPWNDNFNDDYGCGYRWYDENDILPEFAFGHGLSYTEFTYTNLELSATSIEKGQTIEISVLVSNTGPVAGEEVVQLYVSNVNAGIWMPEKQLKGFERVHLAEAESKTVTFVLTAEEFFYWDETNNKYQIEPGSFSVKVGGSSDDLPLEASFEITETSNKPDLRISKILTVPRYPLTGDSVSFIALLQNYGTESIDPGDQIDIEFFINEESIAVASMDNSYIPVGGMLMLEAENQLWVPSDSGYYNVKAIADPNNIISETIESNNERIQTIEVFDTLDIRFLRNIALYKPAYASSQESDDYAPQFAVDGNYGSRWSSEFSDPQEFIVYLRGLYEVYSIQIHWETAYSSNFELSVSTDSLDWITVVTENNGNGGKDSFNIDREARYIRFVGYERASEWGHSFYELEAFGRLIEADPNSVIELPPDPEIKLYPNPTSGSIKILGADPNEEILATICNTSGQIVRRILLGTNRSINVSGIKPGVYFMFLNGDKLHISLKFIKMNN